MRRFTESLTGSTAMLFHVALTAWMFCLSQINNDYEFMHMSCLPLCALLLAAYFADRVMLRRGVPVPVFAALQVMFIGLGVWLMMACVSLEPYKSSPVITSCVIYALGFVIAAYMSWMPGNENGILMRFDGLAVMLILLLVLDEVMGLPAAENCMSMCLVALGFSLLASVSLRSGNLAGRGRAVQGSPVVGRIMLAAALAIMAVLAALVVMFATGGMVSFSEVCIAVIKTLALWVKNGLLWLYGILEQFMLWLASFVDPVDADPLEGMGGAVVSGGDYAGGDGQLPGWIYYVLIGLAAAVLGFIVFRLRHFKVGRIQVSTVNVVPEKRESGLKKALLDLLQRIRSALRYRWNCLRYKKTAPGLLVWVELKTEPGLRRAVGESGESFLRRLSAETASEALLELAALVEQSFYSPVAVTVPAGLYKRIKKGKYKKSDAN